MNRYARSALVAVFALPLFGCGQELNCLVKGDNVFGRVNFSSVAEPDADGRLVVQVSNDSFVSDIESSYVTNDQGFISVPYSACSEYGTIRARAFHDLNFNGVHDAGEPAGRYDGTHGGHATHKTFSLPAPDEDGDSAEQEWPTKEEVNITLDDTAGL